MTDAPINRESRIYVAGHRGMAGAAIVRRLQAGGYRKLLMRSHAELDLTDFASTESFFAAERPDYVFAAAARVGGILANASSPSDFIRDNLAIELNLVEAAHRAGVERLMFLGSSCIYPRDCPQPIREDYLLSGPLEATNQWYAVAKIAGVKLCEAYNIQYGRRYVSVMPTNLYGPGDNYDPVAGHVMAALIRRAVESAERGERRFPVWGSGQPRREFLHVDDLADACVFLMERGYQGPIINIGVGKDISIAELAQEIMAVLGWPAEIVFDRTKPDGTPRKLLDVSRMRAMGWQASIGLEDGVRRTIEVYRRERSLPAA